MKKKKTVQNLKSFLNSVFIQDWRQTGNKSLPELMPNFFHIKYGMNHDKTMVLFYINQLNIEKVKPIKIWT